MVFWPLGGVLDFWCYGLLVFWTSGVLDFWCSGGVLVFWRCFGVLVVLVAENKNTRTPPPDKTPVLVVFWWDSGGILVFWWCFGVLVVFWCSDDLVLMCSDLVQSDLF